jgi:NAD-dependent DNA ligase
LDAADMQHCNEAAVVQEVISEIEVRRNDLAYDPDGVVLRRESGCLRRRGHAVELAARRTGVQVRG